MIKSIGKRLLPLLLSVFMMFTVIPMNAFANDTATVAAQEGTVADFETFIQNGAKENIHFLQ